MSGMGRHRDWQEGVNWEVWEVEEGRRGGDGRRRVGEERSEIDLI